MNINYLNTYFNVIKAGSFSKAAKKLFSSQPNVSYQVKRLEQDIGLPLIDYHKKTIYPTKAGRIVLSFAEKIVREQHVLEHELAMLIDNLVGNLFIVASHIPGEFILPPMLCSFNKEYPSVETNTVLINPSRVIESISSGGYEVGFCSDKPESKNLDYFEIAEDKVMLILYPGHPLAHETEVSIKDLTGESFILRAEPEGKGHTPPDLLLEAGFDFNKSKTKLTMGSNVGVISAVEAGAGIAFMSNLAVRKGESMGTIKTLRLSDVNTTRKYYCVYRNDQTVSHLYKVFIDFIRDKVNDDIIE